MEQEFHRLLVSYFEWYPLLIPLGVIGIWRWSVWGGKKLVGLLYRPKTNRYKASVSVVTPVYNERPATFKRALYSWFKNKPTEIVAVIDHTDKVCIGVFKEFAKNNRQAKLIVTKIPGKRPALAKGIRSARGQIVALVDSDTIWTGNTLKNALSPFADERIAGVATRQSVVRPQTLAQILFSVRLEQRYWDDIPFLAAVGKIMVCLSGRTAFYRRKALLPVLSQMVNERFFDQKVISGEDKRLTYLVQKAGWKTTYQSNAQVFTTGEPNLSTFLSQQVRWTRNMWRSDLGAFYSGWIFKHKLFTLYLLDRAIQPFTLLISPIYFLTAVYFKLWLPVGVILMWWLISRGIKMYPHLRKYPKDIVFLPIFILMTFASAYIRLYALFSLNMQGWITRWEVSRLPQFRLAERLVPHMVTGVICLGIGLGIYSNRYNTFFIPQQRQKELIARILPNVSTVAAASNGNVLGSSTLSRDNRTAKRYELKSGESLQAVAQKFGVEFNDLLIVNAQKFPNLRNVRAGTVLTIPPKGMKLTSSYKFNLYRFYPDPLIISYDKSQNTIVVSGRGSLVGLQSIYERIGKEYLDEIAPKVWYLKANLFLRSGVTLKLDRDEVTWLRMLSNKKNFVRILGFNADIFMDGVLVSSWDETKKDYDKNIKDGRSYILVKDGSRMDLVNSEVAYLGYPRPPTSPYSSYGISWRMSSGKLGTTILTGEVINSKFHHNYFGAYTFGATGMVFRGNEFYENIRYGLDPHDDSTGFLVENNSFHNNGSHGLILSKRCDNNIISNNVSYDNKLHGIMLHELSNNNLIENNTLYRNTDGIALDHSSKNTVRNNRIYENKRGVRANKKSIENIIEKNIITDNSQYGVYLYKEANGNVIKDNTFTKNTNAVYVRSNKNEVVNNVIKDNQVGIYFLGKASNNRIEGNEVENSRFYGVYSKIAEGFTNFLASNNIIKKNKKDVYVLNVN